MHFETHKEQHFFFDFFPIFLFSFFFLLVCGVVLCVFSTVTLLTRSRTVRASFAQRRHGARVGSQHARIGQSGQHARHGRLFALDRAETAVESAQMMLWQQQQIGFIGSIVIVIIGSILIGFIGSIVIGFVGSIVIDFIRFIVIVLIGSILIGFV